MGLWIDRHLWTVWNSEIKGRFTLWISQPNKFIEWKFCNYNTKIPHLVCIGWGSVRRLRSCAIRHCTNFVELICNSQPFFRSRDCFIYIYIYISFSTFQIAFPDSRKISCTVLFPTRKKYPKNANESPVQNTWKEFSFWDSQKCKVKWHNLRRNYMIERRK